ncbi:MAG: WYL domain-containing protein [Candidatus Omnitrophica bacterium]|nr:WYL domain-containing protein [Candidatus Omnitrophota bacterium]
MPAKKKIVTFKRKGSGKPAKDYMKTIERLILILSKLNTNKFVTSSGLAADIGVDMRTIQRDIVLLAGFYPIYSPEKGKHSFMAGFNLGKVELTEEQASLLSFMHGISSSLGDAFEKTFRELFKRVMVPHTDTPFYAKIPSGTFLPQSDCLTEIQKAVDGYEKLKILYLRSNGEEKEYLVEPLKIAFFDGFWYLLTQDANKKIIKFRLDRIRKATQTEDSFVPMAGFDKILEQSVNIWFDTDRPNRVLIRVAPEAAQYFKHRKYFPLQKIVEEKKDGSLVLETFPAHPDEISHLIMHWIPCLSVLEPAEFKARIRETVGVYLKSC